MRSETLLQLCPSYIVNEATNSLITNKKKLPEKKMVNRLSDNAVPNAKRNFLAALASNSKIRSSASVLNNYTLKAFKLDCDLNDK